MAEQEIVIPRSIWARENSKESDSGPAEEQLPSAKVTASIHYDKEDLISFH